MPLSEQVEQINRQLAQHLEGIVDELRRAYLERLQGAHERALRDLDEVRPQLPASLVAPETLTALAATLAPPPPPPIPPATPVPAPPSFAELLAALRRIDGAKMQSELLEGLLEGARGLLRASRALRHLRGRDPRVGRLGLRPGAVGPRRPGSRLRDRLGRSTDCSPDREWSARRRGMRGPRRRALAGSGRRRRRRPDRPPGSAGGGLVRRSRRRRPRDRARRGAVARLRRGADARAARVARTSRHADALRLGTWAEARAPPALERGHPPPRLRPRSLPLPSGSPLPSSRPPSKSSRSRSPSRTMPPPRPRSSPRPLPRPPASRPGDRFRPPMPRPSSSSSPRPLPRSPPPRNPLPAKRSQTSPAPVERLPNPLSSCRRRSSRRRPGRRPRTTRPSLPCPSPKPESRGASRSSSSPPKRTRSSSWLRRSRRRPGSRLPRPRAPRRASRRPVAGCSAVPAAGFGLPVEETTAPLPAQPTPWYEPGGDSADPHRPRSALAGRPQRGRDRDDPSLGPAEHAPGGLAVRDRAHAGSRAALSGRRLAGQ